MDFIKITKDGENCGCDVNGNPNELVEAIYTIMEENDTVKAIICAAVDIYQNTTGEHTE